MNKYSNDEMATDNGSSTGTFIMGALCGAAIGAAIGLLFAPKSGAETRQQLADQTERIRRTAAEQAEWVRQRANDAYGTASKVVGDVVTRGREAVDVGREAYNKARPNGSSSESTIG